MTIRFLAEELYRWTRKVEELERALAALEAGAEAFFTKDNLDVNLIIKWNLVNE